MKKIKLISEIEKWFIGKIKFTHKSNKDDFWLIDIKEPLKMNTPVYYFLFKIMEDQFKDKPELNMWKFSEIFTNSLSVKWKKQTEKDILTMFWKEFKAYTY